MQQILSFLLLQNVLLCSLQDNVLQVVAVLLQHLHHLVHDAVLHARPHGLGPVPDGGKVRPGVRVLGPAVLHQTDNELRQLGVHALGHVPQHVNVGPHLLVPVNDQVENLILTHLLS